MKTLEQMISELIEENAKIKLENFELRQEIKKLKSEVHKWILLTIKKVWQ